MKYIIVAGSFLQYADWLDNNNISLRDRNYVYYMGRITLQGLHPEGCKVVFVGTWKNRPKEELEPLAHYGFVTSVYGKT